MPQPNPMGMAIANLTFRYGPTMSLETEPGAGKGVSADSSHVVEVTWVERLANWLPAAVAVLVCAAILRHFDTPVPVTAGYLAAWVLLVTLPGTVLFRLLRPRTQSFVEDVAMGSVVGLAVQVLLSWLLSRWHLAALSIAWVPAVLLLSVLRSRRGIWRRSQSAPWSHSARWSAAAAVTAAAVWVGGTSLDRNPVAFLDGGGVGARAIPLAVYVDMPYHQSLSAGIDQFWPLVYPYLKDEPLTYHFFAYEHFAAMGRATGIDLTWILLRLHTIPLAALAIVLVGVVSVRVARTNRVIPIAVSAAVLCAAVSPIGWVEYSFLSPGLLTFATFRSPTHTFAVCVLLGAVLVGMLAMRAATPRAAVPLVAAFAVLAFTAGGAKSTSLPVLIAACALTTVIEAVRRRAWRIAGLLTLVATFAFVIVTVLVIGTSTDRVSIVPLDVFRSFPVASTLQIAHSGAATHAVVLVGTLLAWCAAGAGVLVLFLDRESRQSVDLPLLGGLVLAGLSGTLITSAHSSELYFIYAAWPAVPILSAWGLQVAARRRKDVVLLGVGAAVGALALLGVRRSFSSAPEVAGGARHALAALAPPWLTLVAVVAIAGAVTFILSSRPARGRVGRGTWTVAVCASLLVGAACVDRVHAVGESVAALSRAPYFETEGVLVPRGVGIAAVRLRDLSQPEDVVATNAHCYGPTCDARHFIVSALTERRTLVEGWAYPDRDRGQGPWRRTNPYWDAERFDANEIVFTDPSTANVQALADEYGVRWLFVDRTVARESQDLREYATIVYENEEAAVYRIGG